MKGYQTLKQYSQDYKLYLAAKRIDPGREGENITSFLKKKIDQKLKNSSKRFRKMLKNNKYSYEDLKLIATHDAIGEIAELKDFIRVCFGDNYNFKYYTRLISTNAFKSGRLKRIYDFIPFSIQTKREFIDFVRNNKHLAKSELNMIMKNICKENWNNWIEDSLKEGIITFKRGHIYA